jgi:hypothetical protein
MKKLFLITVIVLIFSCTKILVDQENIDYIRLKISINDQYYYNIFCYHIYFENIQDHSRSFGINNLDKNNFMTVIIYPGKYNIYTYGLTIKSSVSKNVYSYSIKKNIDLFDQINTIEINMDILKPKINLEYSKEENVYNLIISMQDISEIFSLSSFSLKQGSDSYKKIYLDYNASLFCYISNIDIIQNGSWYANISFYLKNKYDEKLCEQDNIQISTSYFNDIFLGEY